MRKADWLEGASPAFRLAIATSWLAPDSWRQNQERAIRKLLRRDRTGRNISLWSSVTRLRP